MNNPFSNPCNSSGRVFEGDETTAVEISAGRRGEL
jgi:hypothetical protein